MDDSPAAQQYVAIVMNDITKNLYQNEQYRDQLKNELAAEKSKSEEQNPKSQAELLNCSGIQLNLASYSATVNKNPIELTVTEFRLLKAFIENKNNVLTREQLIEAAYPEDTYLNDRAVDCHIKRLRKKIGSESIETIYGLGYKFNENHAGVN